MDKIIVETTNVKIIGAYSSLRLSNKSPISAIEGKAR
jgi:hypothetical protein